VLHGGAALVSRLSAGLGLHALSTWATALIFMALAEVVARTAVLPASTAESRWRLSDEQRLAERSPSGDGPVTADPAMKR
uniref:hypothetical protein n=1 Tax=Pseudomonas viridiflava TaxID=33069 RepID=UPI00197CD369